MAAKKTVALNPLTDKQKQDIREDFSNWSGMTMNDPPESEYQIVVYCDYGKDHRLDREQVFSFLEDWMCE